MNKLERILRQHRSQNRSQSLRLTLRLSQRLNRNPMRLSLNHQRLNLRLSQLRCLNLNPSQNRN